MRCFDQTSASSIMRASCLSDILYKACTLPCEQDEEASTASAGRWTLEGGQGSKKVLFERKSTRSAL